MSARRAAILLIGLMFAAGCGGGGGGGARPPVSSTPSATTRQTIGVGGGTASVNFGIYTAMVNVPAGALPTTTTVSITLYGPGHGPHTVQQVARRSARDLGGAAHELAQVVIDTGGVALQLPVRLSLIGIATPPSGTSVRLAGYGTTDGFMDVDTATLTGNNASEDDSLLYPDASLASQTDYAFYEIPSADVLPPPTPVVTIAGTNPAPAGTTTQFTAIETDGTGFPFLVTSFTYSLDTPAVGSISSSGLLSAGALDATGDITAVDSTPGRGSPTGTVTVAISSQRPGATGDAFAFTGTVTSTDQLTGFTQPQTQTATIALTSTAGDTSVSGANANVTTTSNEIDSYRLQTITTATTTVTSYGLTPDFAYVALASTDATDSNNAEYVTTYGSNNGLLDVLPETAGPFGPNDAGLTYNEYDPANFGATRNVNPDGSYTEMDTDAFDDVETITLNSNESGTFDGSQFASDLFGFSAPSGNPRTITISDTYNGNTTTEQIPSWIPVGAVPSTETDVDNGTHNFPSSCAVPAKYGTSGNQIVETIVRVDAPLGNLETESVTTYTTPGYGPVCMQMTDHVATFYDYNGLEGQFFATSTDGHTPLETTDIAETLTLSSATTSVGTLAHAQRGAAAARPTTTVRSASPARTSSSTKPAAFAQSVRVAPMAFARARFERLVREHLKTRMPIVVRRAAAHGARKK